MDDNSSQQRRRVGTAKKLIYHPLSPKRPCTAPGEGTGYVLSNTSVRAAGTPKKGAALRALSACRTTTVPSSSTRHQPLLLGATATSGASQQLQLPGSNSSGASQQRFLAGSVTSQHASSCLNQDKASTTGSTPGSKPGSGCSSVASQSQTQQKRNWHEPPLNTGRPWFMHPVPDPGQPAVLQMHHQQHHQTRHDLTRQQQQQQQQQPAVAGHPHVSEPVFGFDTKATTWNFHPEDRFSTLTQPQQTQQSRHATLQPPSQLVGRPTVQQLLRYVHSDCNAATKEDLGSTRHAQMGFGSGPQTAGARLIGSMWRVLPGGERQLEGDRLWTEYYGPVAGGRRMHEYYGGAYDRDGKHSYKVY